MSVIIIVGFIWGICKLISAASAAGKSVSGFILDAVWEYIENHKEET